MSDTPHGRARWTWNGKLRDVWGCLLRKDGKGGPGSESQGKGIDEGSAWTMMGAKTKEGDSVSLPFFLFLFLLSLFWIDRSISPSSLSFLGESTTILYEFAARFFAVDVGSFGVCVCVGSMKPSIPGRIDSCTTCRCERSPRFGRACDDVRSGRKVGDRGCSRQPQSNKIQKGRAFWTTTCDGRNGPRTDRQTKMDGRTDVR